MKKILQTIKKCSDCPYRELYIKSDIKYFRCDHSKFEGENDFRPTDNLISNGCPLVDVGVKVGIAVILITKDDKILIGQRINTSSGEGMWGLPGGRMDLWEDPIETAVRETQEETGIVINESHLQYVFLTNDIFKESDEHWITLYYATKVWEGEAEIMEPNKCKEWKWVNLNELPDNVFCRWEELLRDLLKRTDINYEYERDY